MKIEEFSERLWEFAARVGKLVDTLPDTRLGSHVATRLVQSATASAPRYDEAFSIEDSGDSALRLALATGAMRETLGWLRFTHRAALLPAIRLHELIDESEQLLNKLTESMLTARGRAGPAASDGQAHQTLTSRIAGLKGLDHLAIAVPNTEEALKTWRDSLGLRVLYTEDVNEGTLRLTQLDLGNAQLQLIQPLTPDHPLQAWLRQHGPGLHHFCLLVNDVGAAKESSPTPSAPTMHQGTQGKRALFLDKTSTQGVQVELTGR